MQMNEAEFIKRLRIISSEVLCDYDREVKDWAPEPSPLTTRFSAIGDKLAELTLSSGVGVGPDVYELVELALVTGDDDLQTAVNTGLIEAMVARSFDEVSGWSRIRERLGPKSLSHAESWIGGS